MPAHCIVYMLTVLQYHVRPARACVHYLGQAPVVPCFLTLLATEHNMRRLVAVLLSPFEKFSSLRIGESSEGDLRSLHCASTESSDTHADGIKAEGARKRNSH